MNQAWLVIILIVVVCLILAPSMLLINRAFNRDPEDIDDLSKESLMKLDIKKSLLNTLDKWIKENNCTHVQIADKLSTNLNVVSNIVYQRFDKFTVDHLVNLVLRTGTSVRFIITNRDEPLTELTPNHAEILALAIETFGAKAIAIQWLNTKNSALGTTPLAIAASDDGLIEVKKILYAISNGGVV
jgi:predicted XRE-type DNA-binding protein